MRSYNPADESDVQEAARLLAEPWMLAQLALNPGYVSWGPHEDYMWKKGDGWDTPAIIDSWPECEFSLDELNEVVHFYFEVNRPAERCPVCSGTGDHPHAQWITESWYRHNSPFTRPNADEERAKAILARFGGHSPSGVLGRGVYPPDDLLDLYGLPFFEHCVSTMENGGAWDTAITQDEVDALWEKGRLQLEFPGGTPPAAAAVNAWAARRTGIGHDAINRWVCCSRRCERLGIPATCTRCEGHGDLFTGPAYLSLILWVLHPRKGCSRGVEVNHIRESDLPAVYAYLRQAAERNAQRFAAVPVAMEVPA